MDSLAPTDGPAPLHIPNDPLPIALVLHDGNAGGGSQALGRAEATGFPFIEKRLAIRFPWACLPPQLWFMPLRAAGGSTASLVPPWPDLVIGCGRNTAMPALAIRRASGGRTVAAQVQYPGVGRSEFDLLVVPEHDHLEGPRFVVTRGAVHRVTQARLAAEKLRFPALAQMPRPVLSVLIRGAGKGYGRTVGRLGEIAETLAAILRTDGGSVLLTASRRTGAPGLALLRRRPTGLSAALWDGSGENPYFAYLALADAFWVTADSVSMISEAAATGKPVHILSLDGGNAKLFRFHEAMQEAGITRPFAGGVQSWSYPVPDDTVRAGAALRALALSRFEHRER